MNFSIPTQIYSEPDCVTKHAALFAKGGTKALLVTGRTSAVKTGALHQVGNALTSQNIPFCVYNQIEENPSVETICAAADYARSEHADFVIGIGGGSPMDAAKAIALLLANPDKSSDILYQKGELPAAPVFAVPTTAGTGSEATPYAILTLHSAKTKRGIAHRIFPMAAFVDPGYLTFAPVSVRNHTAVDAFGHLAESYFNRNASLYSRMCCEYALKLWGSAAGSLQSGTLGDTDYLKLCNASTMAGMAISHTGTSIPHGLSYFLTYEHGHAHGKAVGVFLVPYLRNCPTQDEVNYFLSLMGLESLTQLEELLLALLTPVTVSTAERERYIASMLSNQAKLANCPYDITKDILADYFDQNALIVLA